MHFCSEPTIWKHLENISSIVFFFWKFLICFLLESDVCSSRSNCDFSIKRVKGWRPVCRFHQHLTRSFCIDFLSPKIQIQTVSTKKLLIICKWNWQPACQFHQHFTSSFCTDFPLDKKLLTQTLSQENLHAKNTSVWKSCLYVECWWY